MTNVMLTAYCCCTLCTKGTGINAAGRHPVEGISIAAPRSIPLGTIVRVVIPELKFTNTFRVDDRMARRWDGKRWDIYIQSHKKAKQFGLRKGTVTIIKTNK